MAATRQLQQQAAEALQRHVGEALRPGVGAAEWAEHEQLLRTIEVQYLKHLDVLRALDQLRRQPARSREPDLSQPPPHSIDVVDGLWGQVRTEEQEIGQLRIDGDLLDKLTEEQSDALKATSRALWQEAERPAEDETSVAGLRRPWLRELGELRLRHAEAVLGAPASATPQPALGCSRSATSCGGGRWWRGCGSSAPTCWPCSTTCAAASRPKSSERRASPATRAATPNAGGGPVRDGEAVLRRALRDTDGVEALPGNWLDSLRMQREAASVADRLRLLYAEVGALAGGLWNFELVAVED